MKPLVKDQEKFIVRLPDGMRERIKEKAERDGISMNEAVVNALEGAFQQSPSSEADTVELLENCVDALMRECRRLSDETKKLKKQKAEAHATLKSTASLLEDR